MVVTTESIVYLVTALLGFFPGTTLMNILKNKWGLEDKGAFGMITIVSLLLGLVGMAVSGQLGVAESISLENVIQLSTVWFTGSQIFYRLFMKKVQ